ncbi:MAG TPA: nascent polypeptide-associated complex protein [Candidatus Thermoplasmatota archaeon]|nr:nascent polypeptide-associated complex protein [Candidatus Thermoplasmatota archaeon]
MLPGMGGMDPRQMAMMMRKLGIEMRDVEHVQEVVVRTRDREYRFAKPSVSVMKAQGSETWQVQGRPQVAELGAAASPKPAAPALSASAPAEPAAPLAIPEEDVRMVAEQSGRDAATARKALEASGGDLAEAIVRLSQAGPR